MHHTLRGLDLQLDLFIYLLVLTVLTTLAMPTDDTNSTNTSSHRGPQQRRMPLNPAAPALSGAPGRSEGFGGRGYVEISNYPPPPARRGQGVPDSLQTLPNSFDFADSKSSSGTPPLPPTLAAESLFSHIRLVYSDFFNFWGPKIIKNLTSIKPSKNLKNRTPGCPKLDFGAILDPPHPPGAGRVKLHGYNQKPNWTKRPLPKSLPRLPGNGPSGFRGSIYLPGLRYICLTFRPHLFAMIFGCPFSGIFLGPILASFCLRFRSIPHTFSAPVSTCISHWFVSISESWILESYGFTFVKLWFPQNHPTWTIWVNPLFPITFLLHFWTPLASNFNIILHWFVDAFSNDIF